MKKQLWHDHLILTNYAKRFIVGLLVALLWLFTVVPSAQAGDPATGLIQVPVRWCAVEGSPAVTNPAGVGEPDTDNVLWRRHERASDRIWIPGANITFRSGLTRDIGRYDFPVIDDPQSPTDGGPGQLGDILDPDIDNSEMNNAKAECERRWNQMATGTSLLGPIAINVRQIVNNSGTPIFPAMGRGNWNAAGVSLAQACEDPSRATSFSGWLYITDNSFSLSFDPDEKILAHELGHVLFLGHGNGLDDDSDRVYDSFCDSDEDGLNTPATLMHPNGNSSTRSITTLQRGTSRTVAQKISGTQIDPPAALINGEVIGDQGVDTVHDVRDESVDIVSLTMANNTRQEKTVFSHGLFGIIPLKANHQYLVFADLDRNSATGGAPSNLGFKTRFQGAELVTRVVVTLTDTGEFRVVTPTVWKFQRGRFVEVTDPGIRANVLTSREVETDVPMFDVVSIEMPNAVRGTAAPRVRLQAIAEQLDPQGQLDRLPDDSPNGGVGIALIPPQFPTCSVSPPSVPAGGIATVEATGLLPDQIAKLFLGDRMVGTKPIDGSGNVKADFFVPSDAEAGSRLVTVGVMGTALTADCSANVTPPTLSRYQYAPKLVCGIQEDPSNMRLASGLYATTINIHNPGLSKVSFTKKLALTFPPGDQEPGNVLPIARDELGPNQAVAVDCNDVRKRVFNDTFPTPYIEGFVVIQSPRSLDVTGVYTTANFNGENNSVDVEQIRERVTKTDDREQSVDPNKDIASLSAVNSDSSRSGTIGISSKIEEVKARESTFSRLFPKREHRYKSHAISLLSGALGPMQENSSDHTNHKSALEAGFTFLGQFIAHDLTEFQVVDEKKKLGALR